MSTITTHVLDTHVGRPAGGMRIALSRAGEGGEAELLATVMTDENGRADVLGGSAADAGMYTLRFGTGEHYAARGVETFYPYVEVAFRIEGDEHYHVPLLLSPFGYSTYRGS